MTELEFTYNGKCSEATFIASAIDDVVQIEREDSKNPPSIQIFTRIDDSFTWKLAKSVTPMPNPFICQIAVPEGMQVKLSVNGNVTKGGLL